MLDAQGVTISVSRCRLGEQADLVEKRYAAGKAMLNSTFTPRGLKDVDGLPSLSIQSGRYFQVANEFREMARSETSTWPGNMYVVPAIAMYTAAFEAFLQERLALSLHLETVRTAGRESIIADIKSLKAQQDFKVWVKGIYRLYDPAGSGFDPNSEEYQNLIALKELRNSLVHYNASFIEYTQWPNRVQQALQLSNITVMNAHWVSNFLRVEVADWAYDTIRAAVELFCCISSAENPFTTQASGGTLNWNYVRPGTCL